MNNSPSAYQFDIANFLKININNDDDKNIAAAKIKSKIFPAIYPDKELKNSTEKQISLGFKLGVNLKKYDIIIASAILRRKLREYNMYLLEKLNLKENERIKILYYDNESKEISIEEKIVSSIGKNLRVYFKGRRGEKSSWPINIIK